ncbi:Williams Beuren syndrome chromosomal region 16 [Fasciola hepatica]|uniref:Williams Beuren syndrome chromosomal region 16 n=1 Tax=Fasciola hepatica TaxID=6192 RepID=A0A2H1BX37_FASHE|nr:Williams Beuren syndrome chromosomal region 16 [Fasciola hepatica]
MYRVCSRLIFCRTVLVQRVFYSKRVKQRQQLRDNVDCHVTSDYSWSGKQVYAFGFAATGALGIKPAVLPKESGNTNRFHAVGYPVKLSSFCKNHSPLAAACGYGFTLYICKNKTSDYGVYGCGLNSDGQLGQLSCIEGQLDTGEPVYAVPVPTLVPLPLSQTDSADLKPTHIACGRAHSLVGLCSLTSSSVPPIVFGLGNNAFGQCGREIIEGEVFDPKSCVVSRIVLPKEIRGFKQLCCGQDHSLLLSTDGVVYSAGLGSDGQTGLGHLGVTDRFSPVRGSICDLFVEQIASRGDTVLALTRCGRLFAWGNNEYGQIWTVNDNLQVSEPVELPLDKCSVPSEIRGQLTQVSIRRPSSIACAGSMCSLVDEQGHVFVWGFGCLGLGPKVNHAPVPTLIPPGLFSNASPGTFHRLISVTSGLHHFVVRNADGLLWAWGAPRGGLHCLGLGSGLAATSERQTYPMPLSVPAEVVDVACGVDHTILLAKSLA